MAVNLGKIIKLDYRLKRRNFIQQASFSVLATQLPQSNSLAINKSNVNWHAIAKQFRHSKSTINFNSGSSGVLSNATIKALHKNTAALAQLSPYKIFEKWQPAIKSIKQQLAESLAVELTELAIVRNTTEAINIILSGYNYEPNSTVIFAKHDYPYVKNTIKNLSRQHGFGYKELDFNIEKLSDEAIVKEYEKAIVKNVKFLILTHLTHAIGRILPVKKIIEIAHKNKVEVLLDAAHAYAHINHSITDLNCDYYATSLHKWLNAPYGTGLLYIKKDKVKNIKNPANAYDIESNNINKFEQLGTRAFQNIVAIQPAIIFHNQLTIALKQKRLLTLSNYFTDALNAANITNLEIITKQNLMQYAGIVTFKITGASSKKITNLLFKKYGIIVKSTSLYKGSGIRISNNIFILKKDIDYLVEAINTISKTL